MSNADLFELTDSDWAAHITGGADPRLVTPQDLRFNAATVAPSTFVAVLERRADPDRG